ncbi:MAG: CDP-glycerol glycerophosphotransferase family protein [Eubacteriales bacterium]|nr:CDP-glycerol glycerophosphotransferase family protein [Eubacteriales bacterium]
MKEAMLRGRFFLSIRERIDKGLARLSRKIVYSKVPVQNNKVFAATFDNAYNCNPGYIVSELVKRDLPIDIVMVASKNGDMIGGENLPAGVRTVKRGTLDMFQEQASAKIWIDNALNCVWFDIPKKKDQVYINTWHGSMGIKKLGGDDKWMRLASKANGVTDYCVTNSKFEEDVFKNTFWKDVPCLKYGHARNDILFNEEKRSELRKKIREMYRIPEDGKILLYAPTFRDNGSTSAFNIDYKKLKEALDERFGGDWYIFVRMHFKNKRVQNRIRTGQYIKNATEFSDMQKLMCAVDAGITDYSSWAYDYVLTRRPLFLYIPDIKSYDQARGFYYNINTTPFPRAMNNKELCQSILDFDEEKYQRDVEEFLESKGCYEDGHAAERIADKIEEIMGLR